MPTVLAAVSGDARCLDHLFRPGFFGRVHSIFAKVVNVCDKDEELFSLAAADLDNAPHTVLVAFPAEFRFDAAGIVSGDPVTSGRGVLAVGPRLTVDAAGAASWQDVLPRFPAGRSLGILAANLAVLADIIAATGTGGGLKEYYTGGGQGDSSLFSRELAARAAGLVAALEAADFIAAAGCGRSLLGLGTGQTPSGDDFLAGLLTVFHLPGSPFGEDYRKLSQRLSREAERLTAAISQAMLHQAAEGRARQSVISLLEALIAGEALQIGTAAARVLALGSSSGTDIAVGLASGLRHGLWLLEKQAKEDRHDNQNNNPKKCIP